MNENKSEYLHVLLPVWQKVTEMCISNLILFLFLLDEQTGQFFTLCKNIWDNITEREYIIIFVSVLS